MNAASIQEHLKNHPEDVCSVLEKLGYEPKDHGGYLTMRNPDGDNTSAIVVYKNSLRYENYTRDEHGNLFTLVMDRCDCSFPDALRHIVKWCNLVVGNVKVTYPFGGFYRHLEVDDADDVRFKVYKQSELPSSDSLSEKFFKDNIDFLTQEVFGVRYDHKSDSVLIPIYGYHGQLVGCKARRNASDVDFGSRWYAYLPYSKTSLVYGWYQNYKSIVEKGICIITESEKGVQQLYSMGCKLGLAVAGHDISHVQSKYIKLLGCNEIIIAFDEDVEEDKLEIECSKLKTDSNKVFYIKDRDHKYLEFGSKNAPTDLGLDVFRALCKECKIKYTEKVER